jgi:GxxExxY protein
MTELIFKQECHQIVGCAMEVLNTVGHGFHEKIYENGLMVEFKLQSIPALQQPEFPITYKAVELGKYIPDLICFEQIIVDTKTIEKISDHEVGQILNYLKVTGLQVGLLINFRHARLEWKRVVLQRNKEPRMDTNERE